MAKRKTCIMPQCNGIAKEYQPLKPHYEGIDGELKVNLCSEHKYIFNY